MRFHLVKNIRKNVESNQNLRKIVMPLQAICFEYSLKYFLSQIKIVSVTNLTQHLPQSNERFAHQNVKNNRTKHPQT